MKKYFVLTLLLATVAIGCKKQFLEPNNFNGVTSDKYFIDEKSLDDLTVGVYKFFLANGDYRAKGLYGCVMWVFADGGADLVNSRGQQWDRNPQDFQNGVQNGDNAVLSQIWSDNYGVIRRANDVIDNADKVPANQIKVMKTQNYIAEATFLRALAYFNLIRVFGGRPHVPGEDKWGVPLIVNAITNTNDLIKPRNTVSEVYAQIIKDLEYADEHLPEMWPATLNGLATKGRAVKGSAQALMAKAYMTKAGTGSSTQDWTKAGEWADKIINGGKFSLFSGTSGPFKNNSYASLFRIDGGGENSVESLFEIQSVNDAPGHYGFGDSYNNFLSSNSNFAGNTKGNAHPTVAFVSMYEENDLRKEASVFVPGDNFYPDMGGGNPLMIGSQVYVYPAPGQTRPPGQTSTSTGYNVKKFVSGKAIYDLWETGPANPRVLRFAEMLLIKAEAQNEISGPDAASQYVNQVRARAGLPGLVGLSKEQMREAIWKERALELFMEADRWFDLKRTDRLIDAMKKNAETFAPANAVNFTGTDKHYIMPVPTREVNATTVNGSPVLEQAPEYN